MTGGECVTVAGSLEAELNDVLSRYGVSLERVADDEAIPGTYWGEPEAGVVGSCVYVRSDTPLHSALHEAGHIICASPERRKRLRRDAGSDDLEEAAVCYLQVKLAEAIPSLGAGRLMQDMDSWGYSFRLGSTERWYREDADDARDWLRRACLMDDHGNLIWSLRTTADPC